MSSPSDDGEADFSCNICLSTCVEPVITLCGHLYCWPCLFRWMDGSQPGSNECPCCKAGISRSNVIPMYGRGGVNRRKNAAAPSAAPSAAAAAASSTSDSRPEGAPESAAAPASAPSFAASSADSTASSSSAASDLSAAAAAASSSGPIPDRPAAQRPAAAPRPAARGAGAGGWGGGGGGPFGFGGGHPFGPFGGFHVGGGGHGAGGGGLTFFGMGFGLVPSLLTFAFAAMQANNPQAEDEQQQEGQPPRPQSSPFGTLMLWLGILVILMLIYA